MSRVGYKLRREIRDLFPAKTTPAERVVALEIADDANEKNRISLIRIEVLCGRAGLGEDGLRKALQRLAGRGLEFRISRGKGSDGRDIYARNREDINYRVPTVDEFANAHGLILGGTTVPPNGSGKPVDNPREQPLSTRTRQDHSTARTTLGRTTVPPYKPAPWGGLGGQLRLSQKLEITQKSNPAQQPRSQLK